MNLSDHERRVLSGATGTAGERMAMEIVVEAARMMGADRLVPIVSGHIDGCLYHGDAGVLFCEKLAEEGARVAVPATTNVGSLNLLKADQVQLPEARRRMAYRLMMAHQRMGCIPSWTCAPYQTQARPALGQQIAWGESNAVAFANTVLGARTNRYGDFLDLACAISGRAPYYGLHCPENRAARLLFEVSGLPGPLLREDAFFAVLGALVGRLAGDAVSVVDGIPGPVREDQLKAFCAAAAATGAVALAHIAGVTPEAPDAATALDRAPPEVTVRVTRWAWTRATASASQDPARSIASPSAVLTSRATNAATCWRWPRAGSSGSRFTSVWGGTPWPGCGRTGRMRRYRAWESSSSSTPASW